MFRRYRHRLLVSVTERSRICVGCYDGARHLSITREQAERRELGTRFDRVWQYWWDFMRQQKRLSWFVSGYAQLALIFPFVVGSPRYFAGAIELGVLMQIVSAFGNVQGALSWFVSNFGGNTENGLAPWKATIDRLTGFIDAMAFAFLRPATSLCRTGPAA